MAKKYSPCKTALSNYKKVNYTHIPTGGIKSATLTADPWSYVRNHLLRSQQGKRGDNKKRLDRALLYIKLAEDFFKAGEIVDLPTKGTLYYYGMMNLVKGFLCTQGTNLEESIEHHGLTTSPPLMEQVKVLNTGQTLSIFKDFVKKLNQISFAEEIINLKDIFKHIPELHNTYNSVFPSEKPKFLPIQIDYCVTDDHKYLITQLRYRKEYQRQYPCHKFSKGPRKDYFIRLKSENYVGAIDPEWVTYRSRKRKVLKTGVNDNWDTLYANIHKEYSKFDICSILTRQGYFYYCDLEPGSYHHLSYSYMALFYIGTAARYKPLEFNKILDGELRPLVTEAIAICPRQFLYQISSLITNQPCVMPYAKI